MSIHNEAKKSEIAKVVLMPGDPLRAKYMAENFLENAKLVNQTRNIFAYTGTYKGKKISVMASGMGMPSMGIYSYELYQFYDVDTIIRIGSCGTYGQDLNLQDLVLVNESFTFGTFAQQMSGEKCDTVKPSKEINQLIEETAKKQDIPFIKTNVLCGEIFDAYNLQLENYLEKIPKDKKITCSEMESFALFYTAKMLHKKAACLLTVTDFITTNPSARKLTSEEREKSLNTMINLALESAIKIQ